MDLNTREIFRKNSLEVFNQLSLSSDIDDDLFEDIQSRIDSIEVSEIKKFVYLFLGNKLFLLEKYTFANTAYQKTSMSLMNFFELMSFLDTCVYSGELIFRKKLINYSIQRILKEKRLNLIHDFILKMKSIRVEKDIIDELLGNFVLCSGDSSFVGESEEDILNITKGNVQEFLSKIDYWKNDERILEAILQIPKDIYETLNPELKDKIKFYGLTHFHKTLIGDIGSFDWEKYVNFLLTTGRSVGYEEVNRIVFDFSINIDQVKLLDLKSLSLDNEKMNRVEEVMGEIGLAKEFNEEVIDEIENLKDITIDDIDMKYSQGLDDNTKTFIQSVSQTEPTAALEYIKFLDSTKTKEIIDELESKIFGFRTSDSEDLIRSQVNKAYVYIKICIYASEFARALKMMDFVISKFPLAKRELASFVRLKKELKSKWKKG